MHIVTPTPQSWPSIQPRPQPAPPALGRPTSDLDLAYVRHILAIQAARPIALTALDGDAMLQHRIEQVAAQIDAAKAWIKALVEDTAEHVALAKRPDDIVEAAMGDMAGDVIGRLEQAVERNS